MPNELRSQEIENPVDVAEVSSLVCQHAIAQLTNGNSTSSHDYTKLVSALYMACLAISTS